MWSKEASQPKMDIQCELEINMCYFKSLRLSIVKADIANLVLQGEKKVKEKQNSKASKQTNKNP